jgi:hypothetical protein
VKISGDNLGKTISVGFFVNFPVIIVSSPISPKVSTKKPVEVRGNGERKSGNPPRLGSPFHRGILSASPISPGLASPLSREIS